MADLFFLELVMTTLEIASCRSEKNSHARASDLPVTQDTSSKRSVTSYVLSVQDVIQENMSMSEHDS
ncbi:Protein of unknown function [Gryllus bimaculatus]|nr:Protein of unknown function [Gryllus bimaculatus]